MFSRLPPSLYLVLTVVATVFLFCEAIKVLKSNRRGALTLLAFSFGAGFASARKIVQVYFDSFINWIGYFSTASIIMGIIGSILLFSMPEKNRPLGGAKRLVNWQVVIIVVVVGTLVFLNLKYG